MDVLSGTYMLPIVKMDISKYIQTYIKDHHNNMQVMIGKVPLIEYMYKCMHYKDTCSSSS